MYLDSGLGLTQKNVLLLKSLKGGQINRRRKGVSWVCSHRSVQLDMRRTATWYSRPGCFEWKKQTPGLSENGVGWGSEQPPCLLPIDT